MKHQPFIIITLGTFIMNDALQSAMESFRLFKNGLTKKHFSKIQLIIIEKEEYLADVQNMADFYDIAENIKIIVLDDQEKVTMSYKNGSIIFLPTHNNIKKIIPEALSFGLPILTFKEQNESKIIDNSCGMLVDSWNLGNSIIQFAEVLRNLYFDPDVTQILKKGAKAKYQQEFKFSRRR